MEDINTKVKTDKGHSALVFFVITVFVLGIYFVLHVYMQKNKPVYEFYLDGKQINEIMQCENSWHYDDIDFVPCDINGTFGGLFHETLNYSLSPQENCQYWGGTFTGFNAFNDSRNKEIYDSLLPQCWNINPANINEEWLSENCVEDEVCDIDTTPSESIKNANCKNYKCGGNLVVKER